MDENGGGLPLDISKMLSEVQHRWLRPAEISEILRNYRRFHISLEAPDNPVSGSVFLFDRKALRYFRKDGHNWRKKKDGKTVKEAHEKLKVGSVDMLHCYYAHGEDNENFQRRSYWLLEQGLMHMVFVHYLEVQGNKANASYSRNVDGAASSSENKFSMSSGFRGTSPTSPLSSAHEDAESESIHQASSDFRPHSESPLSVEFHYAHSSSYDPPFNFGKIVYTGEENGMGLCDTYLDEKGQYPLLKLLLSGEVNGDAAKQDSMEEMINEHISLFPKKTQLGGLQSEESLKKVDSFSRWMDKELGEADDLATRPCSGISWSIIGTEYESNMPEQLNLDTETLSPSISQDQLYSITDFSPQWTYSNQEIKVIIAGIFLKGDVDLSESRWSVMFGQVEVPAEVLGDGILCCSAPLLDPGLLPFYVTCSNRLACSEIREFEYRARISPNSCSHELDEVSVAVMHLYQRFETILRIEPHGDPLSSTVDGFDEQTVSRRIISLREEETVTTQMDSLCLGEVLLEKKLKDMFFSWFLRRVGEGGKGLTFFDQGGQSVLHLAAGLGFSWAFQPFIVLGVKIDFRDVNGWTALHWSAFWGREDAVAALVSLGAGPGLLTDPSAKYPLGRTPADLASSNGHKGISGFLAETSLTRHLSTLTVNVDGSSSAVSEVNAYQMRPERLSVLAVEADVHDKLSLAAVCNASQAAARIHQIFRFQSFQRKQLTELDLDTEQTISLIAGTVSRCANSSGRADAAAIRIQKKYRGWKKRKEFLLIRQKVVKIQAHVRGHQVRKKYKTIIWSVGIMEKVILRWRRKRRGLRGFRQNGVETDSTTQRPLPSTEDDYDVLKQGRRQTELRMQKALDRVKSMARYPEARAQYQRLITAAEGFHEPKDASDTVIPDAIDDDLTEVAAGMLDDETFISLTFQ